MNNNYYTAKQIQDKFGLDIPVLFDSSLAKACGVYSTPQAVLIDNNQNLYYRGNYNRSRYCTRQKKQAMPNLPSKACCTITGNCRSIRWR